MSLQSMALLAAFVAQSTSQASEETAAQTKMLQTFYRSIATRYAFVLEENGATAELEKQPVLSWTGQDGGTVTGDVFVWTHKGRPEVVGCIGSLSERGTRRGVFNEFHSLTTAKTLKPVNMLTGRPWKPLKAGIQPINVPGTVIPSDAPARRLIQMRQIAREFVPRMEVPAQSGPDAKEKQGHEKLRLLPQPLYRYNAKAIQGHPHVIDGAIFSYVWARGTDPELLLLVEARQTKDGLKWCYAPARFTYRELWLDHKGEEVWHGPAGNGCDTYTGPYITEYHREYTLSEIREMNAKQLEE